MTDRDVLTRLDDALDPLLPPGPPPVADLVVRGRSVRRRRAGVRAGLAAAVAVVAVVVGLSVVGRPGPVVEPPSSPATADASVPDGWRLVGLDGVAVAVPRDWRQQSGCFRPRGGYGLGLAWASGTGTACVELARGTIDQPESASLIDQNGLTVFTMRQRCPDVEPCDGPVATVVAPDRGVVLSIVGDDPGVADSLQPMPAGITAVPPLTDPESYDRSCREVFAAGLVLGREGATSDLCDAYTAGPVELEPPSGTVLPIGSVVVRAGSFAGRVGFGGVSVEAPVTWTPSPACTNTPGLRVGQGCDGPGVSFHPAVLWPGSNDERRTVNGLQVAIHYGCPPNAGCLSPERPFAYVIVTALDLQVSVSAPTRAVIDQIIASLAPIPDGFVAVPEVDYGVNDGEAVLALEEAGLVADLPEVNFPHYVTVTEPTAGTIVPDGSTVRIGVGDG